MSTEKTLSKVDADLAAGDLSMACQRLRGLVASFPERFDLRERLAHVYRLRGDHVQAGRWTYLADERKAAEVTAFEKATGDPVARMRALKWTTTPDQAATPVSRERLAALREAARSQTNDPALTYADLGTDRWIRPHRTTVTDRIAVGVFLLVLSLLVIGVIDGLRIVLSWAF